MMQKLAALLLLCSALHGVVWTTAQHSLNVDLNKVLFTVNRQFLSVCIDAYDLTNPHDPQWSPAVFPARAINMAKALSPAMLRVGGTSGDHLVFNNASLKGNAQMSPEQWDALNEFAINVGWDFVFGLNVLLRQGVTNSSAGTWDPSNAKQLIEYTESKGYKVNWELGNEPKLLPNVTITARELAHDFATLADLLKVTNYSAWIVGPDIIITSLFFLSEFLKWIESEGKFLHAVTWHQYTLNGKTAKQEDYTKLITLDLCLSNLIEIGFVFELSGYHGELWLGETADAYDGGVNGASNTYLGGFLWMDKLGATARLNYSRVFRQTFVGGYYGLLNNSYQPVPTYWISVLHKKLVGTRVLSVLDHMTYVRMYSHCGLSAPGSVVLLVVSISQSDTEVTIKNPQLQQSSRDVYWLTPSVPGHLDSSGIALGGKVLALDGDNLPQFDPTHQQPSSTMMIPSLSYGFIVFKDAAATACK